MNQAPTAGPGDHCDACNTIVADDDTCACTAACDRCAGSGIVTRERIVGHAIETDVDDCHRCNGTGIDPGGDQ